MEKGGRVSADEPGVEDLITVARAIAIIDGQVIFPRVIEVDLHRAHGHVLATDVEADRDYPPFDKSLMDGFAVRSADVVTTPAQLKLVGEIAAGQWPDRAVGAGEAIAIMTGAPMPAGADGVVPVEETEITRTGSERFVRVRRANQPARHIAKRGSDCPAGRVVLTRGTKLEAAQIAVAASVGASPILLCARPRVAVIGTGDELVPFGSTPGPAQIRDSNTAMLVALLNRLGYDAANLGFARDNRNLIKQTLAGALATYDAVFITGGMSMGDYDYVPQVLVELGVALKITKLRIKPGKPFVFGVKDNSGQRAEASGQGAVGSGQWGVGKADVRRLEGTTTDPDRPGSSSLPTAPCPLPTRFVFGLPGNPVSGFACTLRLAARLLDRLAGGTPREDWIEGRLTEPLAANGPREFYQPVVRVGASITPLQWKGSADVYTLARANGLMVRAENEPAQSAGAVVRVLPIPM